LNRRNLVLRGGDFGERAVVRFLIAALLLAAAVWRGWIDWQATIGEGYAYRLTSIGGALEQTWPETYAGLVAAWAAVDLPYVWDPIGRTFLALPLAAVLFALAVLVWITRRRRRR
jgi:hypothetical protein